MLLVDERRGRGHEVDTSRPMTAITSAATAAASAGIQAARDRAGENREIGAGLHLPGAAQHLVRLQMLGQDGVFDRPEKGRNARPSPSARPAAAARNAGKAPPRRRDMIAISSDLMMRMMRALSLAVGQLPGQREKRKKGR